MLEDYWNWTMLVALIDSASLSIDAHLHACHGKSKCKKFQMKTTRQEYERSKIVKTMQLTFGIEL